MKSAIKRAVSVILIFAALIVPATFAFASEDYTEYADKLIAFGIIDNGFNTEGRVTRGDFAKYAVKIRGVNVPSEKNPFTDVANDSENAPYIAAAYSLGIMNGVSAAEFAPDEFVTPEQAAKVAVMVSGYGEIAAYKGGYMNTAMSLGMFKDVEPDSDGYLTGGACLKLMMNVLFCDAAQLINAGGRYEYSVDESMSVLEHNLKIKRGYGILETDNFASIHGGRPTENGYAEIDGEQYLTGGVDTSGYLGYMTEFYYKTDGDESVLVYIAPKKGANTVITADADDIVSADNYGFKYYKENAKKADTGKYSKSTVLIYNRRQTALSAELLTPKIGSVTLIDNNNDGSTDVVIVKEYKLAVIDNISLKKDAAIISDADGTDILKDSDKVYVEKDGKQSDISGLSVGDVLLVMDAAPYGSEKKSVFIYASSKKVSGTVTGIWDDKAVIDKTEYETRIDIDKGKIGVYGVFGLDIFGKIGSASFAGDRVYGFLKNSKKSDFDDVEALIFTENGRWVQLNLRNRVKYNGNSVSKTDFYNNTLNNYVGMITYRVDSDGNICEINTPLTAERWSDEYDKAIENDVFRQAYSLNNQIYREYLDAIGTHIPYGYLTAQTKIFVVPSLSKDADPDDFSIMGRSSFFAGETINADIYIYDTDEFNNMGACLLVGYESSINVAADAAVIDKYGKASIDGRECYYISCMKDGTMRKYYTYDCNVTVPKEGSVVLFQQNPDGFITGIRTVYDAAGGFEQQRLISGPNIVNGMFCGKIVKSSAKERKFAVDFNHSLGTTVFSSKLNPKVYVYYAERGIVEAGTEEDIVPGRYCFVKANNLRATTVVVFNE